MYKFLKRLFEIVITFISLILLLPLFVVVAILIALEDKGNPFFIQKRYGKNRKIFNMYKFRSMKNVKGMHYTTASDSRITKVGAFIRRFKIDELPQLFNVLIGDMSFVGPRPDIEEHVKYYTLDADIAFKVKPGITGLVAYVYKAEQEILDTFNDKEKRDDFFINKLIPEKCRLNRLYVEHASFSIDIQIFFATFGLLKKVIVDGVEYRPLKKKDII